MHTSLSHLNLNNDEDLLWDFAQVERMVPPEVKSVSQEFNRTGFDELIKPLRQLVQTDTVTGIDYALLKGVNDSKGNVIIHFNPFANGMTDNMLLHAKYLKRAFDGFGIADNRGQLLPVITLSAPSGNRRIKLQKHHHQATAKGDFKLLAQHYASIIQAHGYKNIRLIGFSQGASLAIALAAIAPQMKLRVSHVAIGEPVNIMQQRKMVMVRRFAVGAKHLKQVVESSQIIPLKEVHARESLLRYCLGILQRPRLNINLLRGLSKATFIKDLEASLVNQARITIGFGCLTTVCPSAVMREIIGSVRHLPDYQQYQVQTVEVKGAHHAWADQLDVLATFYGYALTR